jgi:hypothetical protein
VLALATDSVGLAASLGLRLRLRLLLSGCETGGCFAANNFRHVRGCNSLGKWLPVFEALIRGLKSNLMKLPVPQNDHSGQPFEQGGGRT